MRLQTRCWCKAWRLSRSWFSSDLVSHSKLPTLPTSRVKSSGIQTRIDSRAPVVAHAAHIGNVNNNRNMIGPVVGVQPFGGGGLSGTVLRAGGSHYLYRFCAEQTITVNTTAAGGRGVVDSDAFNLGYW